MITLKEYQDALAEVERLENLDYERTPEESETLKELRYECREYEIDNFNTPGQENNDLLEFDDEEDEECPVCGQQTTNGDCTEVTCPLSPFFHNSLEDEDED